MSDANSERARTAIVTHEKFFWHDTGTVSIPGIIEPILHDDSPNPKRRMLSLLRVSDLWGDLLDLEPTEASLEDLLNVHTLSYIEHVRSLSRTGGGDAGEFAPTGPGSYDIARLAAGAVATAARAVINAQTINAFALVRPPGHHAEASRGRGYCIFHNVAVAVESLRGLGVSRAAIVDWDVHHGNGAQSLYWERSDLLSISVHQDGLYPKDTGKISEIGGGEGLGYNINVPLPPGSGIGAYSLALDQIIEPALRNYRPQIVFVSAGFDSSVMDPLGRMLLTAKHYLQLTDRLVSVAEDVCEGRVVVVTEGGYSSMYVPFCGLAVVASLAGRPEVIVDPYETPIPYPYDALQAGQAEAIDDCREFLSQRGSLLS